MEVKKLIMTFGIELLNAKEGKPHLVGSLANATPLDSKMETAIAINIYSFFINPRHKVLI